MADVPDGGGGGGGGFDKLTAKVGPLPLWAWGAVTVVGILAYEVLRKRSAVTTTAGGATDGTTANTTDPSLGDVNVPAADSTGTLGALYALQAEIAHLDAQHVGSGTKTGTDPFHRPAQITRRSPAPWGDRTPLETTRQSADPWHPAWEPPPTHPHLNPTPGGPPRTVRP